MSDQPIELTREHLNGMIEERAQKLLDEFAAQQKSEQLTRIESAVSTLLSNRGESPKEEPKGAAFGRIVRALAAGRGDVARAEVVARKWYGEDDKASKALTKALSSTDATAGGFLVEDEISRDVIELLRAQSVVRQAGPRVVPLDTGTLRIPKHTTGSTGGWIGENQNVPATEPAFGQVVLNAKKYAALVPISNDLLRRASVDADTIVRDDMVAEMATATDLAYLRGSGVAGQPKGLTQWVTGTNITGDSVQEATFDLLSAMQRMMDNNVTVVLGNMHWFFAPRTWKYLVGMRGADDQLVFKPEMDQGTLFGVRYSLSTQIPTNLGGGTESEILLVNMPDVVIGDATRIMVDVSSEAAYHDGSNVVAAFSLDQTVIRAIMETDIVLRHDEGVELIDAVTWNVTVS